MAHGKSPMTRDAFSRALRNVPNEPEPEIIQAAKEIGVDPQNLRNLLDEGLRQYAAQNITE